MACAVMVTAEMCFAQTGHQPPSPSVYVERAVLVDKSPVRQYVGMVEAIQHVDVMPRVTGWLLKTSFAEGSLVKKGDLLLTFDEKAIAEKYDTATTLVITNHEEFEDITITLDDDFINFFQQT